MVTHPFIAEKFQASTWGRQRLTGILWKFVVPLAILAVLFFLDYPLRAFVRSHHSPFLNHFFYVIEYGGKALVGFGLAAILMIVGKYANKQRLLRAGKLMALSLVLSGIIVLVAKPALGIHPRNEFVTEAKQDPSAMRWGRFPSGDTTVAFSIAASLSVEFPPLIIPCYVLGFLVGVERVYFNMHFFSDVFAGTWLAIAMVGFLRKKYFYRLKPS